MASARWPRCGVAGPAVALLLGLAGSLRPVHGQIFHFEDAPTPVEKSLSAHYIFYVYSKEDAPDGSQNDATLEFRGLYSKSLSKDRTTSALSGYQGVQVSILPYFDFYKLLSPDKFCSTAEDVRRKTAAAQDQLLVHRSKEDIETGVFSHTIPFLANLNDEGQPDERLVLKESGAYVLLYSNCGSFDQGAATGEVVVKNPYGFLPGIEYRKLSLYGWLMVFHGILLFLWLASILRWWKDLFYVHSGIALIITIGVVEAALWAAVYEDWNLTGVRKKPMFFAAILSSVLKTAAIYVIVLVASLGSGVTIPDLDSKTSMKIHVLTLVFIVLDFGKTSVMAFQHSHAWKMTFKLMFTVPVLIVHLAFLGWIFMAISALVVQLQDMHQYEKVKPFSRMKTILGGVTMMASIACSLIMLDVSSTRVSMWKYHWVISDGLSQALFMVVLLGGIWAWFPGAETARFNSDKIFLAATPKTTGRKSGYRSVPSPEAIGAQDDDGAMML